MGVLHAVSERPCNLADLCERTTLPRATAHRLAVGLETHGMLSRNTAGLWQIGPHMSELASTVQDPLVEASVHVLPHLRDVTGESVQLYRRDGTERLCVASAEPPSGLRDTVPSGTRLSMTAGSGAKVLAAWCADHVRRELLVGASFTERTLAEVRRRGWAQSVAERESGVASVAVPIRDARGTVVAAISVSGPTDRIGSRPGNRWASDLVAAADALRRKLRPETSPAPVTPT